MPLVAIFRVRNTPGTTDAYGDRVAGTTTRTRLPGAFTAPRASTDINDRGRQGVTEGLDLFAPYGTDIAHDDEIDVDGTMYRVDGEPGQWRHPQTGWRAGCQVALTRAAG